RILYRFDGIRSVAVYPVPDPDGGDAVMAALELDEGCGFDADEFCSFLEQQADLAEKWIPRFIRVIDEIPQTATSKVRKTELRNERWDTADELWWRGDRRLLTFERFGGDDKKRWEASFANRGRAAELL